MIRQVAQFYPAVASSVLSTRPQIMVVDDDPHFRSLVRSLLEPSGIAVLEAADARESLRCMHLHDIQLVVLDVVLPGEDGFKALHVLKAVFPKTKVVIATALYIQNTVPLDADGVLSKSEIEHLSPLVDRLLKA